MVEMVKRASGLLVPRDVARAGGRFRGLLIRKGVVIEEFEDKNLIVNQGLDYLVNVGFGLVQPISTWYLAPFTNNYTPVGTDTAQTIAASSGEATTYTAPTRVAFSATEGNQQATNAAAPATFTFNAKTNVYGAFLISSAGQGATTGTLLAAAQFSSLKTPDVNDQLVLTYTFGLASA